MALPLHHQQDHDRASQSTRSAATSRRRACPASRPERLTFATFVNMGAFGGPGRPHRHGPAELGHRQGRRLARARRHRGLLHRRGLGVGRRRQGDGAVIGALIMGVMNNGMQIVGIGSDWQKVIKGLVLLGAVCLDVYNKKAAALRRPSRSRIRRPRAGNDGPPARGADAADAVSGPRRWVRRGADRLACTRASQAGREPRLGQAAARRDPERPPCQLAACPPGPGARRCRRARGRRGARARPAAPARSEPPPPPPRPTGPRSGRAGCRPPWRPAPAPLRSPARMPAPCRGRACRRGRCHSRRRNPCGPRGRVPRVGAARWPRRRWWRARASAPGP